MAYFLCGPGLSRGLRIPAWRCYDITIRRQLEVGVRRKKKLKALERDLAGAADYADWLAAAQAHDDDAFVVEVGHGSVTSG